MSHFAEAYKALQELDVTFYRLGCEASGLSAEDTERRIEALRELHAMERLELLVEELAGEQDYAEPIRQR